MNIRRATTIIIFILISTFISSCTSVIRFSSGSDFGNSKSNSGSASNSNEIDYPKVFRGFASYYADKFHGRKTANGEIFDMNKYTAAHKVLPFGTKLRVQNIKNGKTVIVRINDRGPYAGDRVLDLSKQAAIELDMLNDGVIEVECEILE
ncbi:MAG TPA: septal ring lytic transglycosylase RlpA family protein [Candidatus Kapabacteria bacterium]|nr:septal ring lytic transglycosylase RlpA family protein [Candidatus Kapabacteria bacterium]